MHCGWEFNLGDKVVVDEWVVGRKLQKSNIVLVGEVIVVLVGDDLGDLLPLLVGAGLGSVVLSSNDLDGGGRVSDNAVSGSDG